MGMHVKSALTAMIDRPLNDQLLARLAPKKHTSGEIVKTIALDVQRIGEFAWYMHESWILPLQIELAMLNLSRSVGVLIIVDASPLFSSFNDSAIVFKHHMASSFTCQD
jgi:hypothetical protein